MALPSDLFATISPALEPVDLPRGKVLFEPGEKITHVYFPNQAMVSLVSLMEDESISEIGIIGREGMVGLPAIWGGESSDYQAIVQVEGGGYRLSASLLRQEFCNSVVLRDLLLLYTQALFTHVSQTAVCNAQHHVEARLARWLLIVQDSVQSSRLSLTQEFMAEMLGTRRPSVTVAARALQTEGLIRYSRGKIVVLSRDGLEAKACECYRRVRNEFSRLLHF